MGGGCKGGDYACQLQQSQTQTLYAWGPTGQQVGPGHIGQRTFLAFLSWPSSSVLPPPTLTYILHSTPLSHAAAGLCTPLHPPWYGSCLPSILPHPPLLHRNLSSADAGRQAMRNYSGLIDAIMAYVQNCVAASRCDDKVSGQPWPCLQSLRASL